MAIVSIICLLTNNIHKRCEYIFDKGLRVCAHPIRYFIFSIDFPAVISDITVSSKMVRVENNPEFNPCAATLLGNG